MMRDKIDFSDNGFYNGDDTDCGDDGSVMMMDCEDGGGGGSDIFGGVGDGDIDHIAEMEKA